MKIDDGIQDDFSQIPIVNFYFNEPEQENNQKKQCRICFQEECQNKQALISPCRCSGTSEFVHQSCLIQWITKNMKRKSRREIIRIDQQGYPCQICKFNFKIQVRVEIGCHSASYIKYKMEEQRVIAIVLSLSIIAIFGVLIALTCVLIIQQDSLDVMQVLGLSFSIILFFFCELVIVVVFAKKFIIFNRLAVNMVRMHKMESNSLNFSTKLRHQTEEQLQIEGH